MTSAEAPPARLQSASSAVEIPDGVAHSARSSRSAADAARSGYATLIEVRRLGGRDRAGRSMFVIDLTVVPDHGDPVRSQHRVGVPDEWIGVLVPGVEVPVSVCRGQGGLSVTLTWERDR